jgi:hypothetical protein
MQNIILSNALSKPNILQYHSLEFSGIYFSTVDVILSQATLGYNLSRSAKIDISTIPASSKKSVWSWITKKLGWNNAIEPKNEDIQGKNEDNRGKSEKEPCRLSEFPIPVLRLENSLDHLITLQHLIYQMVFELRMYSDQVMSTSYVYEHIYKALNQSEIQFDPGKEINIAIRQEMYTEIFQMIKNWMKDCYDSKEALRKVEEIIQCFSNLVRF